MSNRHSLPGPPMGNVPANDWYLRILQNLQAINQRIDNLNSTGLPAANNAAAAAINRTINTIETITINGNNITAAFLSVAMNGNVTINANNAPGATGDQLVVKITKDNSGNVYAVTWGNHFAGSPSNFVNQDPNGVTWCQFIGESNNYYQFANWWWPS